MELTISRTVLQEQIARLKGVCENRTTVPILAHTLISLTEDGLSLTATDLETGIVSKVEATGTPGTVTLSTQKLIEIVKSADCDEITIKSLDGDWVQIACGRARFKMLSLDPRSFPAMPNIEGSKDCSEIVIKASVFCGMIDRVIFAVSPDEARYNLSGVSVERIDESLRLVATDGHRLAMVTRPAQISGLSKSIILSRKGIIEIRKLLDEGQNDDIKLTISDNVASVQIGGVTLTARLPEAEFPDYRGVMPKSEAVTRIVSAQRGDLFPALKRVRLMSNERYNGVGLSLNGGDNLILVSLSPDVGEATDEVGIENVKSGDAIKIGCNATYLLDVLSVIPDEGHAQISVINETAPMVVTTPGDEDYRYVVMPMRL